MQSFSADDEGMLGDVGLPTQGSLRLPGPSFATASLVRKLLQINHVKFDWQFNDSGFHNHLSHSILAAFSLGASPDLIQDTFDLHSKIQKPMCALRRKISFQNWTRWLGESEYYSSYLVFFNEEIQKYGAGPTIERYLFKYKEGQLLIRSVSGAIHPLIQMGHGVEFGLDALVAEGLAQACVHSAAVEGLFHKGWPHDEAASNTNTSSTFATAFSHFKALKVPAVAAFSSSRESFTATHLRLDPSRQRHPRLGLSAFTIIAHILKDPRLAAGQANRKDDFPRLESAIRNRGDLIRAWCTEWVIDPAGGWTEIVEKTEEIFWVAAVLVGASSRPGYKPRMDFFMMHALTSAMFLPSMLEILSPSSRIQLLHSHFRVMIGYWVSRGRPYLYIQETLMAVDDLPSPPSEDATRPGAIARAIVKEEQKAKEEAAQSTCAKGASEASSHTRLNHGADTATTGSDKIDAASTGDEQVEVSLNSPSPTEEKADPTEIVTESFEDIQVNDDSNTDGHRTPKQTNGHATFATDSTDSLQSDLKPSRHRQAATSTSAWSDIITAAVDHSDEHVTKMIRSLVFAAQHFGMAPAGVHRSGLRGSELLDGSVFIRLAGILLRAMGWEHYGEAAKDWDRSVLGFDEAWQDETREILAFTAEEKGKGRASRGQDYHPQAYQIGGNHRPRSNTIFESKKDYPRNLDKGKAVGADTPMELDQESEQEKLQGRYYEDDESDPNAFGEHQQWAEGVV